jgi:ABC-2 type transport system ATP-binding protein
VGHPAIEVDDLTVRYGATVAVDRLTFRAESGAITALLGPNGAGKTTTVETLEGFRRPSQGRVRVLGLEPTADHASLTPRIGVMLQEGGVYTGIRPGEVLRLFASYYDDPEDPDELLERVGLADRRRSPWRLLSGGEKQRLSLALALVGRPEVAFLDEPTAGIDPAGRRLIRQTIADLRDRGVGVLLTTHDLDEAQRLADRVLIIDHGHLVAEGSPDELMRSAPSDELRFGAAPGLDTAEITRVVGAPTVELAPGDYLVRAAPDPGRVAALTAWLADRDLPLADLRAGRQTLEDLFLRLTADAGSADR